MFFLALIVSYQSEAWERSILLGEWQFGVFLLTGMIFFPAIYFIREEMDIRIFLRAWSVSSVITVLMAFAGLRDLFKPVSQVALFDNDGFFGIQDLISGELVKHAALSEYGL
ncbi:MAG: hypothetical protein EXS63_08540, partial [Candidatus Omnitrophica bacterium]|nr:hypothetical protein [Candidatus Omnitrophota bacterium]